MSNKPFLIKFFNNLQASLQAGTIWLGATDAAKEGTWIWESSKTTMSYSRFSGGEPNNFEGVENCLAMWSGIDWNDYTCLYPGLATMCEVVFPC